MTLRAAFVLHSGGIDSTTCLLKAIYDFCPPDLAHGYGDTGIIRQFIDKRLDGDNNVGDVDWVESVSIDYGQRHSREMDFADKVAQSLGIKRTIIDLSKSRALSGANVMLTDDSVEIPNMSYSDIHGVSPTYVPFRNGTMLSLITAHAQKWVNEVMRGVTEDVEAGVYFGAHAEDAHNWAYPDCTPEFIGAMANAIYIGSYHKIRLYTPLQWLGKKEIIELGTSLGVPFRDTWSCYAGGELHCGTCPTCRARREGFRVADVLDPTAYAHQEAA